MPQVTYKRMEIKDLNPAEYNPREIDDEELEGLTASVEEFGLVEPLVWNKRTGNLVGGHQRLKVLLAQGVPKAMVSVVDLSLEREKALNVALNNPHIQGRFSDGLQDLLREIKADDRHLFRDVALDKLLEDEARSLGSGLDDAPPCPDEPVTKPGDIWLLGEHRLLCGSCTEHSDVTHLQGEIEGARCMWTDPPYGVDYKGGTGKTIKNDTKEGLRKLLDHAFKLAFDYVLYPGSAVYVAHATATRMTFDIALMQAGFLMRQGLIWVKDSLVLGHSDYHYKHEPIWYGFKPGDGRFGRGGAEGWHGDNKQTTVFEHPKPKRSSEHPTMKPVRLVAEMIANSTRVNDWVYEPFCGSGSTLIACQSLGRRCLAMELDPGYCDVIVERWQNVTGGQAKK